MYDYTPHLSGRPDLAKVGQIGFKMPKCSEIRSEKSRMSSHWGQSNPLWAQIWHPRHPLYLNSDTRVGYISYIWVNLYFSCLSIQSCLSVHESGCGPCPAGWYVTGPCSVRGDDHCQVCAPGTFTGQCSVKHLMSGISGLDQNWARLAVGSNWDKTIIFKDVFSTFCSVKLISHNYISYFYALNQKYILLWILFSPLMKSTYWMQTTQIKNVITRFRVN